MADSGFSDGDGNCDTVQGGYDSGDDLSACSIDSMERELSSFDAESDDEVCFESNPTSVDVGGQQSGTCPDIDSETDVDDVDDDDDQEDDDVCPVEGVEEDEQDEAERDIINEDDDEEDEDDEMDCEDDEDEEAEASDVNDEWSEQESAEDLLACFPLRCSPLTPSARRSNSPWMPSCPKWGPGTAVSSSASSSRTDASSTNNRAACRPPIGSIRSFSAPPGGLARSSSATNHGWVSSMSEDDIDGEHRGDQILAAAASSALPIQERFARLKEHYDQKRRTGFTPDSKRHRKCCDSETRPVPLDLSAAGGSGGKRVHFAPEPHLVKVHHMIVWDYAYRAARIAHWAQLRVDEARFKKRIADLDAIISPVLTSSHRAKHVPALKNNSVPELSLPSARES